jgi:hypothetical protein
MEDYQELTDTVCGIVMEYFTDHCIEYDGELYAIMVDGTVEECVLMGIGSGDIGSIKELLPFDPNPWLEYTRAVLLEKKGDSDN